MKKSLSVKLCLLYAMIIPYAYGQTTIDTYFNHAREAYSGQNAYETTAYVEQFFRIPGNQGFDSSIYHVVDILKKAGFKSEAEFPESRMTYRIERLPMNFPAWEPVSASLHISGQDQPLLEFSTNRNMIYINSYSTPKSGIKAELVFVKSEEELREKDVEGKIVFGEFSGGQLFYQAVLQQKALGILTYRIPSYNRPDIFVHSIPFGSIPYIKNNESWAINLSQHARDQLLEALEQGRVEVEVNIQTKMYPSTELALVADIKGSKLPEERFVFSAHVQEPGANDNASGVGCLAEIARVTSQLIQENKINPARSITFLWGDEIDMTRRYIRQDDQRTSKIKWGMSLDMVGQDTDKTGGVFLIEKMPDPSAIWTRGDDKHTEWGSTFVTKSDLNPHYFNDFIQYICEKQGEFADWKVSNNPYEGGSDHQPFLDAGIPGLLLWHFTDVFYHTDADRIDKVSAETLKNVGVSATVAALLLCSDETLIADQILGITQSAALERLATEFELSFEILNNQDDADLDEQLDILRTWSEWYRNALYTISELPMDQITLNLLKNKILQFQLEIEARADLYLEALKKL